MNRQTEGSIGNYPMSSQIFDFLDFLKSLAKAPISSRLDPALLRPADVTLQIPSTEKFEKATGWKPQYSFEESVAFLLDYWRCEVAKEVMTTD